LQFIYQFTSHLCDSVKRKLKRQ